MIGGIGKKFVTRDELDTILRDLLRRIGQAGFATSIGVGGGGGGGADVPSPSARGDMLRATSAKTWERFAIGVINTILKSDGNDPLWTDEPTLKNLTLSDLIASRPIVSDGAKKLVSIDYTGVTSLRKNLGLETTDSPQFARLGLGAAADGTYLLNLGGTLIHGTATGVGIGRSSGIEGPLHVSYPFAKTDATARMVVVLSSNEASGFNQLYIRGIGAVAQANRYFEFQTGEHGVGDAGNIVLQPRGGAVIIGGTEPGAKLQVNAPSPTGVSLTWGATAGQIFRNEDSELAMGLLDAGPYPYWLQARQITNAARDIVINPLGGNVVIGGTTPQAGYELTVNNDIFAVGDVSALTFIDRTDFFEGDALSGIRNIKALDGELDHSTLPVFAQAARKRNVEEEQIITKTRQKTTKVVKQISSEEVKVIKGKYTKVITVQEQEIDEPMFEEYDLYNEKGKKILDEHGNPIKHKVPVMEEYQVTEKVKTGEEDVVYRNLGNMVSLLTVGMQQVDARLSALEARI